MHLLLISQITEYFSSCLPIITARFYYPTLIQSVSISVSLYPSFLAVKSPMSSILHLYLIYGFSISLSTSMLIFIQIFISEVSLLVVFIISLPISVECRCILINALYIFTFESNEIFDMSNWITQACICLLTIIFCSRTFHSTLYIIAYEKHTNVIYVLPLQLLFN